MKILVVEDDRSLLELICTIFKEEAYEVDCADNGDEGLMLAEKDIYDALVLDIMLPGIDGLAIVKRLRANSIKTPVLFVTARDSVEDRVKGLDFGADDYLVKPFAITELLARVRALLRRVNGEMTAEVVYGPIALQPNLHDGFAGGNALNLTVKEYELLEFFLRNSEQILVREQIFDRIWGFDSESAINVVDVYVHHLRKKLEAHGYGTYIKTVRGIGYMLKGE
ncbi:MAG: response regulator transcription factor [Peptococcaceae bacterium]|nr:response regulator transcription factor [Peptococcaceae bacterium]